MTKLITPDTAPDQERYDPWSDERGKIPVDVAALTACVQRAIREQAPYRERERLWQCYRSELDKAQQITETRMPWEPSDSVSRIGGHDALRCLYTTFSIVADFPTRHRLFKAVADACDDAFGKDSAATPDNGRPGKYGTVTCSRPGCGKTFQARHPSARYCSPRCRTAVWDAKQRAKRSQSLWSRPALLSVRPR